jgi:hypothetical protein
LVAISNTNDVIVIRLKSVNNATVHCILKNSSPRVVVEPGHRFDHFAVYYELLDNPPPLELRPVPMLVYNECMLNDYSSTCTGTEWP